VPTTLTTSQLNEAPALIGDAGAVDAVTQTEGQTVDGVKTFKNRIQLEIVESSWVEVKNKEGVALLRQVLKPGDIYMVPNDEGLVLATGNAGGIKVWVDGKEVAPVGAAAAIKRGVKLDPDELLKAPIPAKPSAVATPAPVPAAPTTVLQPPEDNSTFVTAPPVKKRNSPPPKRAAPSPRDREMINQ